jgi:hypothetical protein
MVFDGTIQDVIDRLWLDCARVAAALQSGTLPRAVRDALHSEGLTEGKLTRYLRRTWRSSETDAQDEDTICLRPHCGVSPVAFESKWIHEHLLHEPIHSNVHCTVVARDRAGRSVKRLATAIAS